VGQVVPMDIVGEALAAADDPLLAVKPLEG
jgi:hypothetical protein